MNSEQSLVLITPDNLNDMSLSVFGDKLSHERWESYTNNVMDIDSDMDYETHYLQWKELQRLLKETILISDELHLGWSHSFSIIYTPFYRRFL